MFIEVNRIGSKTTTEKILINIFCIKFIRQINHLSLYPEACRIYIDGEFFTCAETYTHIKTQMIKKIKESNDITDRFKLMEFD